MSLREVLHLFRRLDAWLIWPALLLVIYGELAHAPVLADVEVHVWDKALHFTAYFGLALMTTIAARAERRALWWALGLIALGGTLEIVQGMTGRDADIFDELANTLGVCGGAGLAWTGVLLLKARKLVDGEP
ncbi:MAG: VanZ family protein [Rhizomicrobium sp.]